MAQLSHQEREEIRLAAEKDVGFNSDYLFQATYGGNGAAMSQAERGRLERIYTDIAIQQKTRELMQQKAEQAERERSLQEQINAQNEQLAALGLMRIPKADETLQRNEGGHRAAEYIRQQEAQTRLNGPSFSLVTVMHNGRTYQLPRQRYSRWPAKYEVDAQGNPAYDLTMFKPVYHPVLVKDGERVVTDSGVRSVPLDLMAHDEVIRHLSGLGVTGTILPKYTSRANRKRSCYFTSGELCARNWWGDDCPGIGVSILLDLDYYYQKHQAAAKHAGDTRSFYYRNMKGGVSKSAVHTIDDVACKFMYFEIVNRRLAAARVPIKIHPCWVPGAYSTFFNKRVPLNTRDEDKAEGSLNREHDIWPDVYLEHPTSQQEFDDWTRRYWSGIIESSWRGDVTIDEFYDLYAKWAKPREDTHVTWDGKPKKKVFNGVRAKMPPPPPL